MNAQDELKNLDVGKLSPQDIQMATVLTLVNLLKKRGILTGEEYTEKLRNIVNEMKIEKDNE
ncbi:hypothetical protein AKG34_10530 [Peribacillus butanolivorans]|uniref:hypothetical protein n=1 Tax=Peribacillus butanolivorans TaxID=421767 RepID=UPI0006A6D9C7|nr:hypothetical protein [Peribacillus butanolivorans]KON69170.1 hypothetical protein AKG34_10530 [Peribacillus butanolivorans]